MYNWNNSFGLNGPSSPATSPPLPTSQSMGSEFVDGYVQPLDGRRTPGPPQPYMGAFSVSDSQQELAHQGTPPYYVGVPSADQHNPHGMLLKNSSQHVPEPRGFGKGSSANSLLCNPLHERQDSRPDLVFAHRPMNGSPRALKSTHGGRVRKSRSKKQSLPTRKVESHEGSEEIDEYKNCHGKEVPPTLKPNCPEEEKCLFQSRWDFRHAKGQDMWESMQGVYEERFDKPAPGKETLQMKFKRGRSKYISWLSEDVS